MAFASSHSHAPCEGSRSRVYRELPSWPAHAAVVTVTYRPACDQEHNQTCTVVRYTSEQSREHAQPHALCAAKSNHTYPGGDAVQARSLGRGRLAVALALLVFALAALAGCGGSTGATAPRRHGRRRQRSGLRLQVRLRLRLLQSFGRSPQSSTRRRLAGRGRARHDRTL